MATYLEELQTWLHEWKETYTVSEEQSLKEQIFSAFLVNLQSFLPCFKYYIKFNSL